MIRDNRFSNNIVNSGAHRNISATKVKVIYINYIITNETKPLNIKMDKTVKQLKKEIEKLFNLNYSLDDYALRVKYGGMNLGKLIQEKDEAKTLFENYFKSECIVSFGKEKNRGGLE